MPNVIVSPACKQIHLILIVRIADYITYTKSLKSIKTVDILHSLEDFWVLYFLNATALLVFFTTRVLNVVVVIPSLVKRMTS